ncbi:MAG: ABC transporter permease [Bacillota bacterium]|uniref:ABC transporter permease n=1 Tax=Desulfurispora thermophila TaxID=265470 RepID=UPI000367E5A6|nr:ABC transporter permease [Desulfurispora thermophila]
MSAYLRRRAATYLLVLVAALAINFFLPRAMPGDPLQEMSSSTGNLAVALDEDTILALQRYYGLDRPLSEQFVNYLTALGHVDLGFSISYRAPVSQVVARALPWTLLITFSALLLTFALAILTATSFALGNRNGETALLVPAILLDSMPPFITGSFLLIIFGVKLGWLPISGAFSNFTGPSAGHKLLDIAAHALLPVLSLSCAGFFSAYLLVRNSLTMVKNQPFVHMAYLKGLSEKRIRYHYVLRTALLPVVTFFGLRLARLIGGAMLVEVLFAYPGLGRLTYEAVLACDYPLLQGVFFIFTIWVLLVNLCTDLLYLRLDPRVKEV